MTSLTSKDFHQVTSITEFQFNVDRFTLLYHESFGDPEVVKVSAFRTDSVDLVHKLKYVSLATPRLDADGVARWEIVYIPERDTGGDAFVFLVRIAE